MSAVNSTCEVSFYTKVSTQLHWIKEKTQDFPPCIPGDNTPTLPPLVTTPPPFKPSPTESCEFNKLLFVKKNNIF